MIFQSQLKLLCLYFGSCYLPTPWGIWFPWAFRDSFGRNAPAPDDLTYQTVIASGYVDAWNRNRVSPQTLGYTNPHDYDLRNTEIKLNQRIDLIMVRKQLEMTNPLDIGPVWAYVIGDELEDMIRNPNDGTMMWPSDHAGIIALLRIPYIGK